MAMHVRGEGARVFLEGTPSDVEQFSTLLLSRAGRNEYRWLRHNGDLVEIHADNRRVTYRVTDAPPAELPPSDQDFVTARLVRDEQVAA
ncbi:hypothetical protein MED01_002381 [Micromonospora sp. MED01]|uniref:hypothetical protein n=1 Tax=Micromonospora alfalfae TaxID=2911212 RepID=UPI001EE7F990|nr:hypothetical protein [Micromonospora alfalfae]MCG5464216.1 hypothetical protein [Micromonospora alfalfae]